MASVICECGKTTATFPSTKPVFSLECFCCDCPARAEHFGRLSGREPLCSDADVLARRRPPLLQYFPGKVVVRSLAEPSSEPGSLLKFSRLREGGGTTHFVARCCSSLLFVDHPGYAGKLLATFPEYAKLSDNFEFRPPCGRIFVRDWELSAFERYERANPIEGGSFFVDHESCQGVQTAPFVPTMDGQKEVAAELMGACGPEAKTALELLGGGPEVEVLGLAEPECSAKRAAGR